MTQNDAENRVLEDDACIMRRIEDEVERRILQCMPRNWRDAFSVLIENYKCVVAENESLRAQLKKSLL